MRLFTKHRCYDLRDAVKHANSCKSLEIQFPTENLADKGQDFLKLKYLIKLHIQGDFSIYEDYRFKLPEEIGQLRRLKKLTLLNLPLKLFPDWIFNLINLDYLTVRGTDIISIPDDIIYLSKLKTLRIENCNLQNLPTTLSQMHHLRHLGLCDTRLTQIKACMFPRNLEELHFEGTGCYQIADIQQLKSDLKQTRVTPDFDNPLTKTGSQLAASADPEAYKYRKA